MADEHSMADIPKEELLHLCMKLNKRMQTMETKGKELLKKKNTLQSERDRLLKMVEGTIGSTVSVLGADGDLDLDRIESLYLSTLAKAATSSVLTATPSSDRLASEPAGSEGSDSNVNVQHYKDTIKTLEQLVQSKQADLDKVNKHLDEVKLHQEEQVVYFQMQLQTSKQREDSMNVEVKNMQLKLSSVQKSLEEKEIHVATNRELLQALQARLIEIEPDLAQAKDKVNTLTVLKMEQDALIQSLRKDLKAALAEKDSFSKRIVEVETDKLKYEGNSVKIQNLTDEVNRKTEELEQLNVLLLRMRAEAASSERNIAMRVAMLATAEAQVAELKEILLKKDSETQDLVQKISSLQIAVSSLEDTLAQNEKTYLSQLTGLEQEVERVKGAGAGEVARVKAECEASIESLKREFNKKNSMARSLLTEREEEVRMLTAKVQHLQEEISSGAPTDRKIFEIAQNQSRRDAMTEMYRDARELCFQQLQTTLESRDLDLAAMQAACASLQVEVLELRRGRQREGVNMDYLKNVLLQYMLLPLPSPERLSLVTVLATLLQFSSKELSEALKATRSPSYTALPVKEVKKGGVPAAPASKGSSAGAAGAGSNKAGLVVTPTKGDVGGYAPPAVSPRGTPLSSEDIDFIAKLEEVSADILSLAGDAGVRGASGGSIRVANMSKSALPAGKVRTDRAEEGKGVSEETSAHL